MWKKKKLTYDICVPPISKPHDAFDSDETYDYFQWYINIIPERIDYLIKVCAKDLKIEENKIDFSAESLLLIWKWFLNIAKTEKNENGHLIMDLQTEYICRDIGMYFGEMFNTNFDSIYWSYYEAPRTDVFVNKPLLKGFKDNCVSPPFDAVFEPIHMVRVQACKILKNRQNVDDLLKIYNIWVEKIPK